MKLSQSGVQYWFSAFFAFAVIALGVTVAQPADAALRLRLKAEKSNKLSKQANTLRLADMVFCSDDLSNCLDSGATVKHSDANYCDNAAANPTDPKRPDGIAGVAFDKIDTQHAIEVCMP